jgi:hypothetical protein
VFSGLLQLPWHANNFKSLLRISCQCTRTTWQCSITPFKVISFDLSADVFILLRDLVYAGRNDTVIDIQYLDVGCWFQLLSIIAHFMYVDRHSESEKLLHQIVDPSYQGLKRARFVYNVCRSICDLGVEVYCHFLLLINLHKHKICAVLQIFLFTLCCMHTPCYIPFQLKRLGHSAVLAGMLLLILFKQLTKTDRNQRAIMLVVTCVVNQIQ